MSKEQVAGRMKRGIARACCWLVVGPLLLAYWLRLVGHRTASEMLAQVSGMAGVLLRGLWYERTLERCGARLFVDWMAVIRTPRAWIGDDVFIGPFCWVGLCEVGQGTMVSGHSRVLSGLHQHGIEAGVEMRRQLGKMERVRIGADCWIGDGAVVAADVAEGCVVGAGSVVIEPTTAGSVVVGSPARMVRERK